jgi:hypothetical protein
VCLRARRVIRLKALLVFTSSLHLNGIFHFHSRLRRELNCR